MKFIKPIAAFLFVIYTIMALNFATPVIGYYIFNEYIISELCIQKDAEENLCMGKCHLKEQIQQSTQDEKNSDQKNVQIKTEKSSPHFLSDKQSYKQINASHNNLSEYIQIELCNYSEPITPPPRLII